MKFLEKVSNNMTKFKFEIKKHSPEILIGAGVVGVVGSCVLACIATTKVEKVLEEKNKKIEQIHAVQEDEELRQSGKYTENDAKKDLTIVYTKTGLELIKLYSPAFLLGALSLSAIIGSHVILNKRNIALTSAYCILNKTFKNYRENVKERFGEKVDFQLKNNIKVKEVETVSVDEKGKQKVEKKEEYFIDSEGNKYSQYSRFFDETNEFWKSDWDYNKTFLLQMQNYANEKLKAQGFLFLNDVYDMLGFPRTQAGQIVGWTFDRKHPDTQAEEHFVDFGIYDVNKPSARDFVNGFEKSILLDFNVEGPVLQTLAD